MCCFSKYKKGPNGRGLAHFTGLVQTLHLPHAALENSHIKQRDHISDHMFTRKRGSCWVHVYYMHLGDVGRFRFGTKMFARVNPLDKQLSINFTGRVKPHSPIRIAVYFDLVFRVNECYFLATRFAYGWVYSSADIRCLQLFLCTNNVKNETVFRFFWFPLRITWLIRNLSTII